MPLLCKRLNVADPYRGQVRLHGLLESFMCPFTFQPPTCSIFCQKRSFLERCFRFDGHFHGPSGGRPGE